VNYSFNFCLFLGDFLYYCCTYKQLVDFFYGESARGKILPVLNTSTSNHTKWSRE